MRYKLSKHQRAIVAIAAALTLGASAAGAATYHRLVTQSTGSGGATAFVQTTESGGALQGENATSANTAIKIPFGVLGEYDNGSQFGIGVVGLSTTGYAVGAEALGSSPAILALNPSKGDGIDAFADGVGEAVNAQSSGSQPTIKATNVGVGDGLDAFSQTLGASAVYGGDENSNGPGFGVMAYSRVGTGLLGYGPAGIGVLGESELGSSSAANTSRQTIGGASLTAFTTTSGTDLIDAVIVSSNEYLSTFRLTYPSVSTSIAHPSSGSDLVTYGDIYVGGNIYGGCNGGQGAANCSQSLSSAQRTNTGVLLRTYDSHTAPTLEDDGEAQLINGFAHVTLEPRFASSIANEHPYLVFTTPQGDSNVLYISRKTPTSFDVRESKGGRSTMTFDYRIVARPFGAFGERLASVSQLDDRRLPSTTIIRQIERAHLTALQHSQARLAAKSEPRLFPKGR